MVKDIALSTFVSFVNAIREIVDATLNNIPLLESNDLWHRRENEVVAARF